MHVPLQLDSIGQQVQIDRLTRKGVRLRKKRNDKGTKIRFLYCGIYISKFNDKIVKIIKINLKPKQFYFLFLINFFKK